MWMNNDEIDQTIRILDARSPEVAPYAKFLGAWRDIVNANSDGWAYWRAGSRCADRLSDLLQQAVNNVRGIGRVEMPLKFDIEKSLIPIRTAATKHKLPKPVLEFPDEEPGPRP